LTFSDPAAKGKKKSHASVAATLEKKLKLSCTEHAEAEIALKDFSKSIWQAERNIWLHPFRQHA